MRTTTLLRLFNLTFGLLLSTVILLQAQELEQLISSKLIVNHEQDYQTLGSNTYQLDGQMLYQTPNTIRLFENNAYRFDIGFSYFGNKEIIDADNYHSLSIALLAPNTSTAQYRIRDIDPADGIISVEAIAIGQAGTQDTLTLELWDKNTSTVMADVIYPIEVHSLDPSANTTAYLPMEMRYQPLFVTLEDINNPNNRIERQLLPFFPDTINVDAKDVFNLLTEVEQEVYLDGEAYVLVADHEKNYGYQAEFNWEGQGLRYKPASDNKLKSYLTVVPGRDRPTVTRPLNLEKMMAADLRKAGLNRTGSRIQQQINFVMPKGEVKKVYTADYLKKHPGLSTSRLDHKSLSNLVNNNKGELNKTYTNNGNIQLITAARLYDAGKLKLQKPMIQQVNPSKTRVTPTNTKPTRTSPRTMQMQKAKIVTKETKQKPVKKPAPNYAVTHIKVLPTETTPEKSPYYTLAIKISRETEPMAYQTYLLTFRVIE